MKKAGFALFIALLSAVLAIAGYRYIDRKNQPHYYVAENQSIRFVNEGPNTFGANQAVAAVPDFVQAAAAVSPPVKISRLQFVRTTASAVVLPKVEATIRR